MRIRSQRQYPRVVVVVARAIVLASLLWGGLYAVSEMVGSLGVGTAGWGRLVSLAVVVSLVVGAVRIHRRGGNAYLWAPALIAANEAGLFIARLTDPRDGGWGEAFGIGMETLAYGWALTYSPVAIIFALWLADIAARELPSGRMDERTAEGGERTDGVAAGPPGGDT